MPRRTTTYAIRLAVEGGGQVKAELDGGHGGEADEVGHASARKETCSIPRLRRRIESVGFESRARIAGTYTLPIDCPKTAGCSWNRTWCDLGTASPRAPWGKVSLRPDEMKGASGHRVGHPCAPALRGGGPAEDHEPDPTPSAALTACALSRRPGRHASPDRRWRDRPRQAVRRPHESGREHAASAGGRPVSHQRDGDR